MSIQTQTDKRTGITYAYETTYYWDKEKQQSRAKRTCIGKVDPNTGNIIPTRGRSKKGESKRQKPKSTPAGVSFSEARHLYYGATYLLEKLADDIGLTKDLKQCFPDKYMQLLSIAFYKRSLLIYDYFVIVLFLIWHLIFLLSQKSITSFAHLL